jgi:uncharacterized membrane-anchored protein YhcB (DUF1043 family)
MSTDLIYILLAAITGVIIGVVLTHIVMKGKLSNLQHSIGSRMQEVEQLKSSNDKLNDEKNNNHARLMRAEGLYDQTQKQIAQVNFQLQETSPALITPTRKKQHCMKSLRTQERNLTTSRTIY